MPEDREAADHIRRAAGAGIEPSASSSNWIDPRDYDDPRVNRALAELLELRIIDHWHVRSYLDNADVVMDTALLAVYVHVKEIKSKADPRPDWERLSYFVKCVAAAYVAAQVSDEPEHVGKIFIDVQNMPGFTD